MSYILDALRKADEERNLAQLPDFNADGSVSGAPANSRLWPWLLAIAVVINVAAVASLYVAMSGPERPARTAAASIASPATAPQSTRALSTETVQTRRIEFATPRPPVEQVKPQPAIEQVKPQPPIEQVVPPPSVEPPPPVEPPDGGTSNSQPVRRLADMDESFQQSVPNMSIDTHVFNDRPGKRFVMINMNRYGEGDRLDEGPEIMTIRRDGVVMHFRERLFLLPLGLR